MNITTEILRIIAPNAPKNVDVFVPYLNKTLFNYEINTPQRIAFFLAQVAHESGGFRYTKEIWGNTPAQKRYERSFIHAWPPDSKDNYNQKAFELGNVNQGDGKLYMGRGMIMITGRANYHLFGVSLKQPDLFIKTPQLVETPQYACMAAGWFWLTHGCNEIADKGLFALETKKINGGLTGEQEREVFLARTKTALQIT